MNRCRRNFNWHNDRFDFSVNTQLVTRGQKHSVMKVRNIHSTEHARALAQGRSTRYL